MNLIIDCGNTTTKVAVFDKDNFVAKSIFESLSIADLQNFIISYKLKKAIVSSVGVLSIEIIQFLKEELEFIIELQSSTPVPLKNNYASPQTLGLDRLAVAVGANYLNPARNCLVIDAGTAITYDFVDEFNTYQGGCISPGLFTRAKALNHFTQRLPLVEPDFANVLVGRNTHQAISSGIINGIVYEIDGYITDFKQNYRDVLFFLTGGDIFYFDKKLKSSIFVSENLLLIGLNRILNFNACL